MKKLKVDKNLICDVCGQAIMFGMSGIQGRTFSCSNPACDHSVTFDFAPNGELPIWVVLRDTYKGIKDFSGVDLSDYVADGHIEE